MADEKEQPIIVIKKKISHGGHHGGAWKVAYADFVTAMMALFIVLWLLNSSQEVQEAVGSYFNDPNGTGELKGSAQSGTGSGIEVAEDNMDQLKEMLDEALKQSPKFEELQDYVQMSVTGEGLRIEMLESDKGMFFQSGSPAPTVQGEDLIAKLTEELAELPNDIVIEGHTDAKPFGGRDNYTNWELSSDRANAARRLMQKHGLRPNQVVQVRGFADQDLRDRSHPEAAGNRRISFIVRYRNPPPGEVTPAGTVKKDSGGGHSAEPAADEHADSEVAKAATEVAKKDAHAAEASPAHEAPASAVQH